MTHPINHTPSKPLYGVFHYFYQDSRCYVGNFFTAVDLRIFGSMGGSHIREIKRIPKKSQGVKSGVQNVITAGKIVFTNIRKRLTQFIDSDVGGGGGGEYNLPDYIQNLVK